jgi:hypothetical protein
MKSSVKLVLLPPTALIVAVVLSLLLALLFGYQIVDVAGTHLRVLPSEFNKVYQPSELKSDLDFLIRTLEAVHPDLYAYTPKPAISLEKKKIESELTSPMSRVDFYLKVAPLIAMLNEGHTKIYPAYEEYYHFVGSGGLLFPFEVEFKDSQAFIGANYSADSLAARGSELQSINGLPVGQITDRLLSLTSSEKRATKLAWLEEFFAHMLWLVYGFEKEFEVEFISKSDGKLHTRTIQGVTYSTIQTQKTIKSEDEEQVHYSYRSLPDEKIGIIDLRLFKDMDDFRSFLRETFTEIQKEGIVDLIIDIRENPGGYSQLEDVLLSYLTDRPVVGFLNMEIKVSKQIKDYYRSTLRWYVKWLPFQYIHPTWRKMWNTPEGGLAVIRREPKKPKDNPLRFSGGVYVLTGPRTYSTAQDFAAAMQDYELGTLIGEETGGVASSFGAWMPFDLPNTRLWVFVSTKRIYRPSGKSDGRGVVPDYEVKQTPEDSGKGMDTVMQFTKELIKSKHGEDAQPMS